MSFDEIGRKRASDLGNLAVVDRQARDHDEIDKILGPQSSREPILVGSTHFKT